ncbi:MAG: hypothetical protein ABW217_19200 [Polyangiaceae bacterium]
MEDSKRGSEGSPDGVSPAVTVEVTPARLPYEPPAIEETSEFETLSLACAKARRQCFPGPYSNS